MLINESGNYLSTENGDITLSAAQTALDNGTALPVNRIWLQHPYTIAGPTTVPVALVPPMALKVVVGLTDGSTQIDEILAKTLLAGGYASPLTA